MLTFSTNKFISHFPVIQIAHKFDSRSIALSAKYMQNFKRKGGELRSLEKFFKGAVHFKGAVFDGTP